VNLHGWKSANSLPRGNPQVGLYSLQFYPWSSEDSHGCFILQPVAKCCDSLKVGGNEKQQGSGRSQMLGNGLGPWRLRFIYNLNTQLLNKNHIAVSALSIKMNKRLLRHKGMGANNGARAHGSSLRQWR
jgi:hypothetical protein